MPTRRRVYISATSADLRSYRDAVADALRKRGLEPEVQDISAPTVLETDEKLRTLIGSCDGAVFLVGVCYGGAPAGQDGSSPRSYTQLEYDLVTADPEVDRMPYWVFVADPWAKFDEHSPEREELRELQMLHRDAVKRSGHDWSEFKNRDQLLRLVAEMELPWRENGEAATSRRSDPSSSPLFTGREDRTNLDQIVNVLVDGNEAERSSTLHQIVISKTLDRNALAARLRAEITDRFAPEYESDFAASPRNPKLTASVRSWMISSLIWADGESPKSRTVILKHVQSDLEPDRNVRFWTLSGLYQSKASYVQEAAFACHSDSAPEVAALAQAISAPNDPSLLGRFRNQLASPEFEVAWSILRLLRVVPLPELAADVCARLERADPGTAISYDALYALAHPEMARTASAILSKSPGIRATVARVLEASRASNPNAVRAFAGFLAAFDAADVDRAVAVARAEPGSEGEARRLAEFLREHRLASDNEFFVAGYASDTIDVRNDRLGIQEDVQTLVAVMLAKDVQPPLAIGLFGDWGAGKSFFMRSMSAAVRSLADRSKGSTGSAFCADVVQIEFNAWHYIDTNLWASLVGFILERLAIYVSPKPTAEERQAAFLSELGSAKLVVREAEEERRRAEESITARQEELRDLRLKRESKEVELRELRAADLTALLSEPEKSQIEKSLREIGVPTAIESLSDLSRVASDAYSVRGRLVAVFVSILNSKNRHVVLALLAVTLLVIPLAAYGLQRLVSNELVIGAAAAVSEFIVVAVAAAKVLQDGLAKAGTHIKVVEQAKRRVDRLLAEKRKHPTQLETALQVEIADLIAKEQEASSRLAAATARVIELEERVRSLKEERSLARFLAERTQSDDYRKHLGLISTIRKDFEALDERLASARSGADVGLRPVDRIVLYVDDLDRCPADKVLEVLQAVHLLLAYPLFVVVVGVDPRWLSYSLRAAHSAFRSGEDGFGPDDGLSRATPQNYLEKIFQIPFRLRPMTTAGFGRLVAGLLVPTPPGSANAVGVREVPSPGGRADSGTDEVPAAPGKDRPGDIGSEPGGPEDLGNAPIPPADSGSEPDSRVYEGSLVITPWEAKFGETLFPLIRTPRAAKRFSNTYRILKAPVRREYLQAFEGTAEIPGDFQVPMLLLAILIGAPIEGADLIRKLQQHASEGRDPSEMLLGPSASGVEAKRQNALEMRVEPIISRAGFPRSPELYLEWIPRVARFTFDLEQHLH